MGIDYGKKRVGVALSDESGTLAFPHEVLKNDTALLMALEDIIAREEVGEIVIGHSLNKAGEENEIHSAAMELMNDLTLALGLPIHLEPEQYSTQEAIRLQGRNEKTDAAAAAIILNSFLSKQK